MRALPLFAAPALLLATLACAAAAPKDPLSKVTCECGCTTTSGDTSFHETKVIAAPDNDPLKCGAFDGLRCRNASPDGSTRIGKLSACTGVVENVRPRVLKRVPPGLLQQAE